MGLEHLKKTEEFLKKNKEPFSMTQLRDEINMNYKTALDVLSYLLKERKIKKIVEKGKTKYRWRE